MLNVEIIYNPYLVETGIEVNGKTLSGDHDLCALCACRRLQDWVDRFWPQLRSLYRERSATVTVNCTSLDGVDVTDSFSRFCSDNSDIEWKLRVNDHDQPISEKFKRLKELFGKAQEGPFEEFRSNSLTHHFNDALSPDFEVNVIATMSSGKSTVVNAMLGQELMPAKNEACTATIARIEDCDGMDVFEGRRMDASGTVINEMRPVSQELLAEWNEDPQTCLMELKGDIKSIEEIDYAKLIFVDTPGPNNSREANHRRTTVEAINRKPLSMVLYVLNATQLNINDDASLLNLVADAMKAGGRKAQDRFIFIANKIDAFDPENGESVSTALDNARNYLRENGIENPLVIPESAETAKLIRVARSYGEDSLSQKQRNDLRGFCELFLAEEEMNMLLHVKDTINPRCHERLTQRLLDAESDYDRVELLSGIPIVEELFNDFLEKHAVPSKIKDAVDSFHHVMVKAEGLEKLQDQLEKKQEDLQAAVEALEAFENNKTRIDAAKKFRKKVSSKKYKPSKELKSTYKGIQKEALDLFADISEEIRDEITPQQAERMIKRAETKCERSIIDIESQIQNALDSEFLNGLEAMREEYEQFVADLLKTEFPASDDIELLEFQKAALCMPDAAVMIEENIYEKKVVTGSRSESDSTWWKPWTWGRKRLVEDCEYHDQVDMSPVWQEIDLALKQAVQENIDASNIAAAEQAELGKEILLSAMDGIDRVWKENLTQMKAASKDRVAAESQIQEIQEKLAWYNGFRTELDAVLSI